MSSSDLLLRSQKNLIFELVKKSGLDPFNFEWGTDPNIDVDDPELPMERLSYKGTNYFFRFYEDSVDFSPGPEKPFLSFRTPKWNTKIQLFERWLECLLREIEQPDMWAELSKYQIPPGEQISIDIENTPFTYPEVVRIADGINQVRNYLEAQFKANENERRLINEKLDYLLEAAKRQGRKDWMHTCIGALVGLTIQLALSPEQTKTIWKIIKATVSGVIKFLPQ
jgi:hypothetical protein